MVLTRRGERVRSLPLTPAPLGHPGEQGSDRDLLVGQPNPRKGVPVDPFAMEAEMVGRDPLQVPAEPSLPPNQPRLDGGRRIHESHQAIVDQLAMTAPNDDPAAPQRV